MLTSCLNDSVYWLNIFKIWFLAAHGLSGPEPLTVFHTHVSLTPQEMAVPAGGSSSSRE